LLRSEFRVPPVPADGVWRVVNGALKCAIKNSKPQQRLPGSMKLNRSLQIQKQSQRRPPKMQAAATKSKPLLRAFFLDV
jgi:hypothetical protein